MKIYLASKSPRRQSLLKQIGIEFVCIKSEIDESVLKGELALDYVKRMASEKAITGWKSSSRIDGMMLLAADTSVILNDKILGENILGKPNNAIDASDMLKKLSGNTHQVITCVSVKTEVLQETIASITNVTFATLSEDDIKNYIKTGDCFDKSGGYGIQGYAAKFISFISGSYSGVVGLPLFETSKLLEKFQQKIDD
jgi:septum formation protein